MEDNLKIKVISTQSGTYIAVNNLVHKKHGNAKVFGVDCEWDIVSEKGAVQKPDLLQIAAPDGYCALFRLNILKTIPPELKDFLEDPQYTKVGVGVIEDTQKLLESYGVDTKGVVDVRHLADEEGIDPRGLSHLSESVLGIKCQKYHYSFHYWTGYLSEAQKKYAAIDAVNGVKIFDKLNHNRICKTWGSKWRTWGENEYHRNTMILWEKYFGKWFEYSRSKYVIGKMVDTMIRLSNLSTSKIY